MSRCGENVQCLKYHIKTRARFKVYTTHLCLCVKPEEKIPPGNLWEDRRIWYLQLNFTPWGSFSSPALPCGTGRAEAEAVLGQYFQSLRCKKSTGNFTSGCAVPEQETKITPRLRDNLQHSCSASRAKLVLSKACLVKLLRVIDFWGRMFIILESMERLLVSIFS